MASSTFIDRLRQRWLHHDTMLCVGLDPDVERLPAGFDATPEDLFRFCCAIVDATADLVCAFKPQIAYFAARGAEAQLERLIDYVHTRHPQVPVILDAKRGDIGDTARMYALEVFERYGADAATVNPYLGRESVEPYLAHADRGVFVLCRTSNPDSAWLQSYPDSHPVYLRVAEGAASWNERGNVMLVTGATYADDLRLIRSAAGDLPLLVPGIGAQGGDLAGVVEAGLDSTGHGLIISASRSVLYAGSGADFADCARVAASALRDDIRCLRRTTAAACDA